MYRDVLPPNLFTLYVMFERLIDVTQSIWYQTVKHFESLFFSGIDRVTKL
jgi:hypothetical protein